MAFLNLLSSAISGLFYGVIATAILMALLRLLLQCLGDNIIHSFVYILTGIPLCILLLFQFSTLFGAVHLKHDISEYSEQVEQRANVELDRGTSSQILDQIIQEFPLLRVFVDDVDESDYPSTVDTVVVCKALNRQLTSYVWRRIGWILGLSIVGCLLPIIYDSLGNHTRRDTYTDETGSTLQF